MYCAVVYIPPYRSKYSHNDPYLELQNEMDKYCQSSRNILLFGDFNSRTAALTDFVECDDFICQLHGNEKVFMEYSDMLSCFEKCNIPVMRITTDCSPNVYGHQLTEFCKNNNIFILNGRMSHDHSEPRLTCKDSSVVDYFLSTAYNFEYLHSFNVHDFDHLFSDAHCPLSVAINIRDVKIESRKVKVKHSEIPNVRLWNEDKSIQYVENINDTEISDINTYLDSLYSENIAAKDINDIVNRIDNVFVANAEQTFGYACNADNTRRTHNKPRCNLQCRNVRNAYHNARKNYNKYKT